MARKLHASSLFWENIVPDAANAWEIDIPTVMSLNSVRESAAGRAYMQQQDQYADFAWARAEISPGTYRVRLPIPGSNNRIFTEQQQSNLHRTATVAAP